MSHSIKCLFLVNVSISKLLINWYFICVIASDHISIQDRPASEPRMAEKISWNDICRGVTWLQVAPSVWKHSATFPTWTAACTDYASAAFTSGPRTKQSIRCVLPQYKIRHVHTMNDPLCIHLHNLKWHLKILDRYFSCHDWAELSNIV